MPQDLHEWTVLLGVNGTAFLGVVDTSALALGVDTLSKSSWSDLVFLLCFLWKF